MSERYDELLNLPRPVSKKHPPMPMRNRAAQFLPFAALNGYEDALSETARETLPRIELSDDEKAALDARLRALSAMERPEATLTVFVPDAAKGGGAYVPIFCAIKRIDPVLRSIRLTDGRTIAIEDVYAVESPAL